jgi:hypothetical protein
MRGGSFARARLILAGAGRPAFNWREAADRA